MFRQTLNKVFILKLLGLACIGLIAFWPRTAAAANPATINFQGKVTNANGTNEAGGTVSRTFVFRLYQNVNISTYDPNSLTCASDSNCVWEETDTLNVTDGVFQVELGAVCPFFTSNACNKSTPLNFSSLNALSLTMKFNGDADGFMSPLMHLQSVPYAYNSDALDGLSAANFVQLAQGLQTDSSNSNASIAINKTGTASLIDLRSSNTTVLSLGNGGNLTITPTGANVGTTIRQTTGTATSGNVFDIQTANGSSHFIQIANSAANEGTLLIQSVGATRDLTLDSGSGTIKLGGNSSVLQKSATTFTLDINSSSNSTLTLTNAGTGVLAVSIEGDVTAGGNVTAGAGSVFKVGSTSGISESACGANQYSQNPVATGGIITTAGGCAYAVNSVGTFSGSSIANGASVTNNQITFGPADGTNPGMVSASGTQTFGGNKTFSGAVNVQAAGGVTIGTTGTAGVLSVYNGTNTVSIQGAGSTAAYSIILPASVAGAANQCLASTGSNGTLQWLPCGAGSTAAIALSPEFVGAVMSGDGSSNTGTMTSDYCAGTNRFPGGINTSVCNNANNNDEHNYYSWTSTGANDYEIFFRWTVPNDFAGFPTTGSSFYGWKTGTAVGDDVKLNVYNNSSTACAAQSMTNTANSWLSTSINLSGCTPSTGTVLTFDIHLSVAASGNFARVGEITLNYNRK